MTIDPDIIKDLLPLYRSGLASPASRRLVESWLAEHSPGPALAGEDGGGDSEAGVLHALEEARRRRRWLRWLFGLAIGQTVLCFTTRIQFEQGMPVSARLLAFDLPWLFVPTAAAAIAFWICYFRLRRRLA